MLLFKQIRFKNVLSFGNYWTELDLSKDNLTVIVGSNGAGKSTFLDCLSFVLFGKTFRKINKPQIVNSITKKNCLVEIEFNSYGHDYKVVRGLKPAVFEIWKDGSLIPQEAAKARADPYQDLLEGDILKCNHKTFCQMVILGAANYTPFFDLPALDRRKFTESIFDLEIISIMNVLMKEERGEIEFKIKELQRRKQNIEVSIQAMEEQNKRNIDKEIYNYKEIIRKHKEKIIREINRIISLKESIQFFDQEEYNNLNKNYDNVNGKIVFARTKIDNLKKLNETILSLDSKSCPCCGHFISSDEANDIISENEKKINAFDQALDILLDNKNTISGRLVEIEEIMDANKGIQEELNLIDDVVKEEDKEIKNWESKIASVKAIENSVITDSSIQLDPINAQLDLLEKQLEKQKIILDLLRDDGVKATILKDNIDIINGLVNQYLMDMDFFCSFYLNEEFEEVIKSRYRDDFSYHSFSQGERLRITLALLLTWREISKRRNSIDTNLLIFDEILDSSLDQEGVGLFLDLIKKLLVGRNVFIISHNNSAIERINNVIRVEKIEGFSRYETE